jgi:hypothetical protein
MAVMATSVLAGCGASDEEREQAIGALADYRSTELAEPVEIEVERVTVEGDFATVRMRGATEDAELTRTDNAGWLISGGIF